MIGLTQDYGNNGIAAARLVGFAATFFSIFYVEKWFFGKVQWAFWGRLARILAVASIAGAVIEYAVSVNLPVSWLSLIISVGCGGLAYCSIIWFLDLATTDEKILVKAILSRKNVNAGKI